jgi:hypothetical protein
MNLENAKLARQSYGIAMAQCTFGGPRGIWLECTGCPESQTIVGSRSEAWANVPTSDAAKVFRRHGWTGIGPTMMRAKCPACAAKAKQK